MTKRLATAFAAAGLTAALMFAQGMGRRDAGGTPPDPQAMIQRHVDSLATLLNLTDAQKVSAAGILTDAHTASQTLQSNMRTARQSLSDAIKKNDTAAIDTLSAGIGTSTGQLTAIQSKAQAALYALLTPEQQAKFDAMPHGGMMGGPGWMGGPGGRGMGPARGRGPQAQ